MQNDRKLEREVGSFRIERLFGLALDRTVEGSAESMRLSGRYLRLAMEIHRHYKIPLPAAMRNGLCKGCGRILIPGRNCKVRVSSEGFVAYACECGRTKRLFLRRRVRNGG